MKGTDILLSDYLGIDYKKFSDIFLILLLIEIVRSILIYFALNKP